MINKINNLAFSIGLAISTLGGAQAFAQTPTVQLDKFISVLHPLPVATPQDLSTNSKQATSNSLSIKDLELGLSVMPITKVGHGGGAMLSGATSKNPNPSSNSFCYEACKTSRAVGSCGTPDYSGNKPPNQKCDALVDTPLLMSIIGPSVGVGHSPFVDNQSGPDGVQPAGYTFLGQFIDHDVTRTQTDLMSAENLLAQMQTDKTVKAKLTAQGITEEGLKKVLANASSPTSSLSAHSGKLDLDSVYGVADFATLTQLNAPWFEKVNGKYTGRFALRHVLAPTSNAAPTQIDGFDYERADDGSAYIPDPRNSEHKILAQIQGLFELAHNDCMNHALGGSSSPSQDQVSAAFNSCHSKVKWTYETIVATDFLPRISSESALSQIAPAALHHYVRDTPFTSILPKPGNIHTYLYQCKYGSGAQGIVPIPHEFAVAGFRLGHSLVRDAYVLHQEVLGKNGDLLTGLPRPIFADAGSPSSTGLAGDNPLESKDVIDWSYFFDTNKDTAQALRPLDTLISDKLFSLPVSSLPPGTGPNGKDTPSELNLARRNILRASTPSDMLSGAVGLATGETEEAYALKRIPGMLDTRSAVHSVLAQHLTKAKFDPESFGGKTPLWLYVLAEAESTQNSSNLGDLGSHIVDEFLLGGLQCDGSSVLYAPQSEMAGWEPTDSIKATGHYSFPELVGYLQKSVTVDGQPIHLSSR